jgi:hypothetical protein
LGGDFLIYYGKYSECLSITNATNKSKKLKLHHKHYVKGEKKHYKKREHVQSKYKSPNYKQVLRKVFGSKRDEVTGEWRKLHNELSDLYSLPNIMRGVKSRRMRWAGHVARMVEGRGVYRVLVGKPEGKRPLGRPRRRWQYNIKMDLQEVGGSCGNWIVLAQDRGRWRALAGTVRNLRVPKMRRFLD